MSIASLSPQKKAQTQAENIERYWASRGFSNVRCVVVVDTDPAGRPVFGVRSNIDLTRLGATTFGQRRR